MKFCFCYKSEKSLIYAWDMQKFLLKLRMLSDILTDTFDLSWESVTKLEDVGISKEWNGRVSDWAQELQLNQKWTVEGTS